MYGISWLADEQRGSQGRQAVVPLGRGHYRWVRGMRLVMILEDVRFGTQAKSGGWAGDTVFLYRDTTLACIYAKRLIRDGCGGYAWKPGLFSEQEMKRRETSNFGTKG